MHSTTNGGTVRRIHQRTVSVPSYADYPAVKALSTAGDESVQRERTDSPHPFTKVVHIERVACPMHVVKLKGSLNGIGVFETLKVIPGSAAVMTELIAACRSLGHKPERNDNEGRAELFVTRMH